MMPPLLRLVPWFRRRRAEREIRRELALHVALDTRQNIERWARAAGGSSASSRPSTC